MLVFYNFERLRTSCLNIIHCKFLVKQWGTHIVRGKKFKLLPQERILLFPCVILNELF